MILLFFSQVSLAESLFSHHYFDLALVEYKRLFLFDSTARSSFQSRFHYTIASLRQKNYSCYEEVNNLLHDFPVIDTHSLMILARELLKVGNYYLAMNILDSLPVCDLTIYALLLNRQYAKAFNQAQKIEPSLTREINDFMHIPEKSVTRAMLFSAIIPGLGEVYAGNIKQGIHDFLLTGISGYLLYYSVKKKQYVDAGLVFTFAFNRFYFGSISNARRIAQKYNNDREDKFLNNIKKKAFE